MSRISRSLFILPLLLLALSLQACGGFHLRGSVTPDGKRVSGKLNSTVQLINVDLNSPFGRNLSTAIRNSGGKLVSSDADYSIRLSNFNEGKYAAGYSRARQVREYSIFLKSDYQIRQKGGEVLVSDTVDVNRTQLYDSEFALGKAEEEQQIRSQLRLEAADMIRARLVFLHKP